MVIGRRGRDIQADNAESHVSGYSSPFRLLIMFTAHIAAAVLAIDMTARNMQDAAKKKGLPWSAAKGFDTFTPIGYSRLYTVTVVGSPLVVHLFPNHRSSTLIT